MNRDKHESLYYRKDDGNLELVQINRHSHAEPWEYTTNEKMPEIKGLSKDKQQAFEEKNRKEFEQLIMESKKRRLKNIKERGLLPWEKHYMKGDCDELQ